MVMQPSTALTSGRADGMYDAPFTLADGVDVRFGAGARVHVETAAGEVTLTPEGMPEAGWFSLEMPIDLSALRQTNHVFARIDMAAKRSSYAHATVEIESSAGRVEASSAQVELRGDSRTQLLTIDLGDIETAEIGAGKRAKLVMVLEPRDVPITLRRVDALAVTDTGAFEAMSRRGVRLHVKGLARQRTITGNHALGRGTRIDIERVDGAFVHMARSKGQVSFDFRASQVCRWRTLEFLFRGVSDPKGNLAALVEFEGRCDAEKSLRLPLTLRLYNEGTGREWNDFNDAGAITIRAERAKSRSLLPLTPMLGGRDRNLTFGVMGFFPPDVSIVDINHMSVRLIDLEAGWKALQLAAQR